ncbi:unnamed protein product [Cuscuta campestris]|uniref:CCT domain-containing protein n=1 Tax=Cuscuta campestris TaxID=132261 RepID=A0A484MRA7_9ASTE|nr:unnamed protein product [Cuscuta campestris]
MHTNDDTPPCGNWPPPSPEHEGGHRHVALPATVLAAAGPELLSAVPPQPLPACRDRLRWEIGAGCSSGGECNNSYGGGSPTAGSSPASGRYGVTGFQEGGGRCQKRPDAYPPPAGFLEPDCGPAGQLFSSGDLQGINKLMAQRNYYCRNNNGVRRRVGVGWWWSESSTPLATESNTIIEGMSKEACRRYTPAEKRQRIDRYRFKRNLRNFNKKIKYECRKTLADNRPRIRGRKTHENAPCGEK